MGGICTIQFLILIKSLFYTVPDIAGFVFYLLPHVFTIVCYIVCFIFKPVACIFGLVAQTLYLVW